MFKFIKRLFTRKSKSDKRTIDRIKQLEKDLPEDFDVPCYLVGYVEGRGYKVLQMDYTQRKDT